MNTDKKCKNPIGNRCNRCRDCCMYDNVCPLDVIDLHKHCPDEEVEDDV